MRRVKYMAALGVCIPLLVFAEYSARVSVPFEFSAGGAVSILKNETSTSAATSTPVGAITPDATSSDVDSAAVFADENTSASSTQNIMEPEPSVQ